MEQTKPIERKQTLAVTRAVTLQGCGQYGQWLQDGNQIPEHYGMTRGKAIHDEITSWIAFGTALSPHIAKILPNKKEVDGKPRYISTMMKYEIRVEGFDIPLTAETDGEYYDDDGVHVVGEWKTGQPAEWHKDQVRFYLALSGAKYGVIFYVDLGETVRVDFDKMIPLMTHPDHLNNLVNKERTPTKCEQCQYCELRKQKKCELFVGESEHAENVLAATIEFDNAEQRKKFLEFSYMTEIKEEVKGLKKEKESLRTIAIKELEMKEYPSGLGTVTKRTASGTTVTKEDYEKYAYAVSKEALSKGIKTMKMAAETSDIDSILTVLQLLEMVNDQCRPDLWKDPEPKKKEFKAFTGTPTSFPSITVRTNKDIKEDDKKSG